MKDKRYQRIQTHEMPPNLIVGCQLNKSSYRKVASQRVSYIVDLRSIGMSRVWLNSSYAKPNTNCVVIFNFVIIKDGGIQFRLVRIKRF